MAHRFWQVKCQSHLTRVDLDARWVTKAGLYEAQHPPKSAAADIVLPDSQRTQVEETIIRLPKRTRRRKARVEKVRKWFDDCLKAVSQIKVPQPSLLFPRGSAELNQGRPATTAPGYDRPIFPEVRPPSPPPATHNSDDEDDDDNPHFYNPETNWKAPNTARWRSHERSPDPLGKRDAELAEQFGMTSTATGLAIKIGSKRGKTLLHQKTPVKRSRAHPGAPPIHQPDPSVSDVPHPMHFAQSTATSAQNPMIIAPSPVVGSSNPVGFPSNPVPFSYNPGYCLPTPASIAQSSGLTARSSAPMVPGLATVAPVPISLAQNPVALPTNPVLINQNSVAQLPVTSNIPIPSAIPVLPFSGYIVAQGNVHHSQPIVSLPPLRAAVLPAGPQPGPPGSNSRPRGRNRGVNHMLRKQERSRRRQEAFAAASSANGGLPASYGGGPPFVGGRPCNGAGPASSDVTHPGCSFWPN